MRKKYLIANWKMHKNRDEVIDFIFGVREKAKEYKNINMILCPSYIHLRSLVTRQGEVVRVGAQNMHYEAKGAYTGEVSGEMLSSLGVEYVIIGHSERRRLYNESNTSVNKKVISAIKNNLRPIVCVGETLEDREEGLAKEKIEMQITKSLRRIDVEDYKKIIITYEPLWAIGTGKTATNKQAGEICSFIRSLIEKMANEEIAKNISILYGGSVKKTNIKKLFDEKDVDGSLVGKASLDFQSYLELAEEIK